VPGEFVMSLPSGALTTGDLSVADLVAFTDVDADVFLMFGAALSDAVRRIAINAQEHNKPVKFVVPPGRLKHVKFAPGPTALREASASSTDAEDAEPANVEDTHQTSRATAETPLPFTGFHEPLDVDRLSFVSALNAVVTQIVAQPPRCPYSPRRFLA
jgi:hypothetical protein